MPRGALWPEPVGSAEHGDPRARTGVAWMVQLEQDGIASDSGTHQEVFSHRVLSPDPAATTVAMRLGGPAALDHRMPGEHPTPDRGRPGPDRHRPGHCTMRTSRRYGTGWPPTRRDSAIAGCSGCRRAARWPRPATGRSGTRTPHVLMMDADDLLYPRCVATLEKALDVSRRIYLIAPSIRPRHSARSWGGDRGSRRRGGPAPRSSRWRSSGRPCGAGRRS